MRAVAILLFLFVPLLANAGITADQRASLCQAASQDSALGPLVDTLIAQKAFTYAEAGSLLSLDCGKGDFILGMLVKQQRAENLEYAVIDLGLNVDAPVVSHNGKHFSISQYLQSIASQKGQLSATFAAGYLKDFHDPSFNPNLMMKVSMN
jgi:hypothetical protein